MRDLTNDDHHVHGISDLMMLGTTDVAIEGFEASLVMFTKALKSDEAQINRI